MRFERRGPTTEELGPGAAARAHRRVLPAPPLRQPISSARFHEVRAPPPVSDCAGEHGCVRIGTLYLVKPSAEGPALTDEHAGGAPAGRVPPQSLVRCPPAPLCRVPRPTPWVLLRIGCPRRQTPDGQGSQPSSPHARSRWAPRASPARRRQEARRHRDGAREPGACEPGVRERRRRARPGAPPPGGTYYPKGLKGPDHQQHAAMGPADATPADATPAYATTSDEPGADTGGGARASKREQGREREQARPRWGPPTRRRSTSRAPAGASRAPAPAGASRARAPAGASGRSIQVKSRIWRGPIQMVANSAEKSELAS